MGEKLYTVSQMAKICNCTAEQLRYYDRMNILCPNKRGDSNNYRYYTEDQIEDILLIKEFKNAGLSLKDIAALMGNRDLHLIKRKLEENMRHLRQELAELHQRYDNLIDALLRITNALDIISRQNPYVVTDSAVEGFEIVQVPKRLIVFTRYQSSYSVEDPFLYRYMELLNIIDKYKLQTSRMITLLFHDHYSKQFTEDRKATGDLELFCTVTSGGRECPHCREFGGFKAICTTHIGHYRDTERVYCELDNWARSQGFKVSGVSFQELIIGRTITDKEKNYVTKIYLPLDVTSI